MRTHLDRIDQNHEVQPILSSSKEMVEKREKIAIDAIIYIIIAR